MGQLIFLSLLAIACVSPISAQDPSEACVEGCSYFDDESEPCDEGWSLFDGHCYFVNEEEVRFIRADRTCKDQESNLASIHSPEEQNYIVDLLSSSKEGYWIGAVFRRAEWTWTDQTDFNYSNFSGEIQVGKCALMWKDTNWKWKATECDLDAASLIAYKIVKAEENTLDVIEGEELTVELSSEEQTNQFTGKNSQNCPEFSQLPIFDKTKKNFYTARIYTGRGGQIASTACNGAGYDVRAGYKTSAPSGKAYYLGTLFVHAGCTFYAFQNYNYQGKMKTFAGPLPLFNVGNLGFGYHCGNVFCARSYAAECRMSMPNCVPKDGWTSVAHIDNSKSTIPTKLTYLYQIGTEWSTEITEEFKVDSSVELAIKASFFKIFSAGATYRFQTGYNWKQTSSEAKNTLERFTIETDIPAKTIWSIEQAQGFCGDSTVMTEMFRTKDVLNNKTQIVQTKCPIIESWPANCTKLK